MDALQSGMRRVGRNDPCPCGSGKKYKNCHMLQEQAAQSGEVQSRRARETAAAKLGEFAQAERFGADIQAAFDLFWDGRLGLDRVQQVGQLHQMRFLDFLLYDYRTSEGATVVELFLKERGPRLGPGELAVAREWRDAAVSVYGIVRGRGNSVVVRDLCRGGEVDVELALPPNLVSPALTFVGRVTSGAKPYVVRDLVLPMPRDRGEALVEWLQPRLGAYAERHYGAGWTEFLKAESYLVNHFLLEDPEFMPAPSRVARPDVDLDRQVADEMVRQIHGGIVVGTLDSHYGQFLDRPIKGWGNRTPRQLVADEQGRRRVELWLARLEEAEAGRRSIGQPAYDVNRLRAQLGLLGPGIF